MKKLFIILMCLRLLGITQSENITLSKESAISAAKKWIEKIDNKKYASSWKDADILVQNAVSIDDWEKTMSAARDPFGEVLSRDIDETKYYKEYQELLMENM